MPCLAFILATERMKYLTKKDKAKKTSKKYHEVSFKEDKFIFTTFGDLLSALTFCNSLKTAAPLFRLHTSIDLRSNKIHKGRSLWSYGSIWIEIK